MTPPEKTYRVKYTDADGHWYNYDPPVTTHKEATRKLLYLRTNHGNIIRESKIVAYLEMPDDSTPA